MNEYVYSPMKATHIHTDIKVYRQRTELYMSNDVGEVRVTSFLGTLGPIAFGMEWGVADPLIG